MSQAPNPAGLSAADRLLHQRIIVLGQEVDDAIANRLCARAAAALGGGPAPRHQPLHQLAPAARSRAGLAIYDTMRLIPNDVSTLAMGLAASMGQFLLSAGTPGKRFALPHARILMHQGSAGIGGTAIDIEIQAENLEHTKNVMMRLIAEHTGQPVEKIERDAPAGPVVHRRGGAGVRLRRPDPHRRRDGDADAAGAERGRDGEVAR